LQNCTKVPVSDAISSLTANIKLLFCTFVSVYCPISRIEQPSAGTKNILKIISEAIDIQIEIVYSPLSGEEVNDGSILHEVSHQEGDEESQGHHHEEWQACHSGDLSYLRYQDVPHW
jgi:hypothetical protein